MQRQYESLVSGLLKACREVYGDSLVSVAIFGSVARGTATPDSDIDLLIVATDLPRGRMNRVAAFEPVEAAVQGEIDQLHAQGLHTEISPVIKTPEGVRQGSPLFLDMTREVMILHDRGGFLEEYLEGLRGRMERLGSRRVRAGGGYYWELKPDFRWGETIEL